jgi:hypothetical protein
MSSEKQKRKCFCGSENEAANDFLLYYFFFERGGGGGGGPPLNEWKYN